MLVACLNQSEGFRSSGARLGLRPQFGGPRLWQTSRLRRPARRALRHFISLQLLLPFPFLDLHHSGSVPLVCLKTETDCKSELSSVSESFCSETVVASENNLLFNDTSNYLLKLIEICDNIVSVSTFHNLIVYRLRNSFRH